MFECLGVDGKEQGAWRANRSREIDTAIICNAIAEINAANSVRNFRARKPSAHQCQIIIGDKWRSMAINIQHSWRHNNTFSSRFTAFGGLNGCICRQRRERTSIILINSSRDVSQILIKFPIEWIVNKFSLRFRLPDGKTVFNWEFRNKAIWMI